MENAFSMIIVLCFLTVCLGDENCDHLIKESKIIPKFARDVKSSDIEVFFDGYRIKCGEQYSINKLTDPPVCALNEDLDFKCDQMTLTFFRTYPPYLHWLVYNIPTENLFMKGFVDDSGDVGTEYDPPTTVDDTTSYVLFFYCQKSSISRMNPDYFNDTKHRENFPIYGHARYFRLGVPEVAMFFRLKD